MLHDILILEYTAVYTAVQCSRTKSKSMMSGRAGGLLEAYKCTVLRPCTLFNRIM